MKQLLALLLLFACVIKVSAQQPPDCQVAKITLYTSILKRGGNPAYKPTGDSIVYQKNYFNWSSLILSTELFVSDTGMNGASCLTCDTNTLPAAIRHDKYKGNAEYHPSGNYMLFTSENENGVHQPWNLPGAGVNHDIFIMDISGTQFWRMTNVPAGHGILHPAFSYDGTKLLWCELYYSTLSPQQGQEYGLWELKMADFDISSGTPQISNIVTFSPRDSVWYETHSFSPDGRYIAFTSHQEDSIAYFGDITIMDTADIGTSNFTLLTNTPYIHDEHAHWSPDGNKISWMSGTYVGGLSTYSSELYLMDANGTNQTRLTYFTDPSHTEYIRDTVVTADHYWSPDGRRIFGFVHYIDSTGWPSMLYQIEFTGPCGMNPTSVDSHVASSGPEIFPNPAEEKVTVNLPNTVYTVEMFNSSGALVCSQQDRSGITTIDVASFAEGLYSCRIRTNDGVTYVQKIVVAR